jgi:hypothetical protein
MNFENSPHAEIGRVGSFQELLTRPFAHGTNALCWERSLPGDFAEVVRLLGPGEEIVALDEERLLGLELSAQGKVAVSVMLEDLRQLREAGRDPVLNIIYGYRKDEDSSDAPPGALAKGGLIFPRDVLSWHVDSAPVEADTWLCTYYGAPSEGLLNEHAVRKVDDPKIRAQLLELYQQSGGVDPQVSGFRFQVSAFTDWLTENHYDLHFAPRNALSLSNGLYSFGVHNLWRTACAWPDSPVPPCVHRAPDTNAPRLLLIS